MGDPGIRRRRRDTTAVHSSSRLVHAEQANTESKRGDATSRHDGGERDRHAELRANLHEVTTKARVHAFGREGAAQDAAAERHRRSQWGRRAGETDEDSDGDGAVRV